MDVPDQAERSSRWLLSIFWLYPDLQSIRWCPPTLGKTVVTQLIDSRDSLTDTPRNSVLLSV